MPTVNNVQLGFAGGEIAPSMYGRNDDIKYQNGLAKCENFIVLPQGPIQNRPGFEFVDECGNEAKAVRLLPFVYNLDQTMVIELGDKYARFHTLGATLVNDDGTPYQIATPWAAEDLFDLNYTQSGDIMTIVHENYAPREIRRYGARDWRVVKITFNSTLSAPESVSAVRASAAAEDPNSEKYQFKYRVSCLNADKSEESPASGIATVTANLYAYGTTVRVSCSPVQGASFYRFYKNVGGLYGYIGDSEETEIIDDQITPKTDITVRRYDTPFANGNNPRAVGYFEQRRVFAGLKNDPQRVLMTCTGTESQLTYSLPLRDDDRVSQRLATGQFNGIRHIVSLSQLIILTTGQEIRVSPLNTDAITPTSFGSRLQGSTGASRVTPLAVGNAVIYAGARGGHIYELGYQYSAGGYISTDLCLRSPHLFEFKNIEDSALMKSPQQIMWFVSSDGLLLGCTYIPAEEVCAWHRHSTDGKFESITAVSEGDEDYLYAVVRREINGQTRRFIERMSSQQLTDLEHAFFVDSGATLEQEQAFTEVSGLTWLEGKTVSILADGAVCPQQVVKNGKVYLDHAAHIVHIGLPYASDAQTLPIFLETPSRGMGMVKNVSKAALLVYQSSGVMAGPSFDELVEHKQRTTEQPGSPPQLLTGEITLQLYPAWTDSGQVCIRQADPLPLTIQSLSFTISV